MVFNVIGIGSPTRFASFSEESQRYYNAYFHGKFVGDSELYPIQTLLAKIREIFWATWGLVLLWTVLYTPCVLLGGVGKALERFSQWLSTKSKAASSNPDVSHGSSRLETAVKDVPLGAYTFWQAVATFAAGLSNDIVRFLGGRIFKGRT